MQRLKTIKKRAFLSLYALVALASFIVTVFADIPSEIERLMGKDGVLTSQINGVKLIHEDGSPCRIMGGDGSPLVQIDSASSMKAWANVELAKSIAINEREVTFQFLADDLPISEKENLCNEVTNIVFLKKTLIVGQKSVTFKVRYRCLFEEVVEVVQGCTIQ